MNPKQTHRRFALLGALVLVSAALAVPSLAIAQDQLSNPSAAQYEPQGGVLGGTANGANSTGSPSVAGTPSGGGGDQIGSLPFTGMDLVIVAGVALLLTGTGLALHRLSVPPHSRG
jgi:uncharacterized membrane protein